MSYCNKHQTQKHACCECVTEAVDRQTRLLEALLELRVRTEVRPHPVSVLSRFKAWWTQHVYL